MSILDQYYDEALNSDNGILVSKRRVWEMARDIRFVSSVELAGTDDEAQLFTKLVAQDVIADPLISAYKQLYDGNPLTAQFIQSSCAQMLSVLGEPLMSTEQDRGTLGNKWESFVGHCAAVVLDRLHELLANEGDAVQLFFDEANEFLAELGIQDGDLMINTKYYVQLYLEDRLKLVHPELMDE